MRWIYRVKKEIRRKSLATNLGKRSFEPYTFVTAFGRLVVGFIVLKVYAPSRHRQCRRRQYVRPFIVTRVIVIPWTVPMGQGLLTGWRMICIRVTRDRVRACLSSYGSRGNRAENPSGAQGLSKKGLWLSRGEARRGRCGGILKLFFYWKLKNRCPSTARKPIPTISSDCFSGSGRFFFIFLCLPLPSAPPLTLSGSHTSRRISRSGS